MKAFEQIPADLEQRRRELGMTFDALARRSGVSVRTAQRVLSGQGDVRLGNLASIASALGVGIRIAPTASTAAMRRKQARSKAEGIVRSTQGSAALEGLAVGREVKDRVRDKIETRLLAGSRKRLWS